MVTMAAMLSPSMGPLGGVLRRHNPSSSPSCYYGHRLLPILSQRSHLVNVRIKWVKDRPLDAAVSRERHLHPAHRLVDLIASDPTLRVPVRHLSHRVHRRLGLRDAVVFMRHHPALFVESRELALLPGAGPASTFFGLTADALRLRQEESQALRESEPELVDRLRRLLMLTSGRALPLDTIDQLSWDMGLPADYRQSVIPRYPHFFHLDIDHHRDHEASEEEEEEEDGTKERVWLRLLAWDDHLAVSQLQRDAGAPKDPNDGSSCLAFPVRFTRGFGLKRKCMAWLAEWQALPYISPYADSSALDPRTDVAEKRMVGVFHELLHLTIARKTERRNVSNLRKPLSLPQKFTKVFERHPGIFYLSQKLATQTVVLREAYGTGGDLLHRHPLLEVRERYMAMMRMGVPNEEEHHDSDSN